MSRLTPTQETAVDNAMAPHADFPEMALESVPQRNGSKFQTHLHSTPENEVHDVVCVGFGPASLAIAVALHDSTKQTGKQQPALKTQPKIAFLERQESFAWHAGMQIPGAKMQISFIKDMATMRNPRSEFTFLNYLHENDRLVQFTNLSTFLPRRIEYEDYLRWCAGWFQNLVSYGHEVVDISPDSKSAEGVTTWKITSRNIHTNELSFRRTKRVVVAVGGHPKIPKAFPQQHPRIIHSSQYWTLSSRIFRDRDAPLKIAVIGSGQSAAEIFQNIPSQFPNSKAYLLIRGAALRPSDDSPFVNEVFDPERTDDTFNQDPAIRAEAIKMDKATNYGVVRLELLEHMYDCLYTQRLVHGDDEANWPQRLLNHREVEDVTELPNDRIRLHIRNDTAKFRRCKASTNESLDVDLVMIASGYRRDHHEQLMSKVRPMMPGGDKPGQKWTVNREYKVQFQEGAVSKDSGVWLQGCNEGTHGLSDSLLSVLAIRGGEMVQSMFGGQ
ncbi:hydroxylase [Aureobasidium pullulans]|uniref:L-ornithine N(5)-monooxygenase [NAD(P)H] n=1 Tax=Aureobasidium pullulans TaxID=5580 RepID=A0A4S8SLJ7_AURPU|nr:hydroxylase [Aureobasidium pullulans]THW91693.1 hydroxylase [Aureobasidium pullulans]THX29765.1 hydroxylase [Aureobasidium pullulans]THX45469.1 hydroxylase [Aureobasidium pullulans]THX63644.1 hydroxylase [Aureobasidium pullulans]